MRGAGAAYVGTWAELYWNMGAVRFVLVIGGSRVERRCSSGEMGSRLFAVNAWEAEVLETVHGAGCIVGVGVSGFANSVYVECCLAAASGEQEQGLAQTWSDLEMVVPKGVGEAVESSWNCSRDVEVDAYSGLEVCDLGQLVCLSGRWMMLVVAVGGRTRSWAWVRLAEWVVHSFDISQLCVPRVA